MQWLDSLDRGDHYRVKAENASLEYGLVSRIHDYFQVYNHPQNKLGAGKFTI